MTASTLDQLLAIAKGGQPASVQDKIDTDPTYAVPLTAEQAQAVLDLHKARELKRVAEAHEESAKKVILEALGESTLGTINGKPVVQITRGTRSGVDTDLLMQGFPEAYEATRKTTTYRTVKPLVAKA